MEVRRIQKQVGLIYFLVDDNFQPIMPVYRYMLYILENRGSSNTCKTYAQHLKLYYQWLQLNNLDYHTAIGIGCEKGKQVLLSNLSNFRFWLEYPDYTDKIIPISGYTSKRQPATINQIMDAVLSFYDFLVFDEGLEQLHIYKEVRINSQFKGFLSQMSKTKKTALSNVLKMKTTKKKPKYITRTEYENLVKAANNLRDKIILGLMFEGGLRVSEVIGLRIGDLREIYKNKINIVKREDPNNPDAFVKYNSEGSTFVSDKLARMINKYLVIYLSNIDTNYVFINLYSKDSKYKNLPMRRDTIEDMVERLGKKIGIAKLHPHMLRHGIAVDMLHHGCDMVQIKDKLRHKDPKTTSTIYAETDDFVRRNAMQSYFEKTKKDFHPDGLAIEQLAELLLNDMED